MKHLFFSLVGTFSLLCIGILTVTYPRVLPAEGAQDAHTVRVHVIDGAATPRISVTPGEHYLIKMPPDVAISAEVAFGDPLARAVAEFYVYRYSGNEWVHATEGRTGDALFDGVFTLSRTLFQRASPDTRAVHTVATPLVPSVYYYLWVRPTTDLTMPFIVGFTDTDGDGWTDSAEDLNGNGIMDSDETNPLNPDTDGDTISDGMERMLSLRLERAPHAPVLDPLRASANAEGMTDAALYDAWLSNGVLCVSSLSDGDGDPFFDAAAVVVDPGCMSPIQ